MAESNLKTDPGYYQSDPQSILDITKVILDITQYYQYYSILPILPILHKTETQIFTNISQYYMANIHQYYISGI